MELKQALTEAGIIRKGHFLLVSGRHSDTYISKDGIYCNPELFERVVRYLDLMDNYENGIRSSELRSNKQSYDIITGPAIAGAILAAPIALRTGKTFVYPEKVYDAQAGRSDPDGPIEMRISHSMQLRRGYADVVKGKRVLLIEDIITTGGSVMETIRCIENAGGEVVEIRCIWNRSMKGGRVMNNLFVIHGDDFHMTDMNSTVCSDSRCIPILSLISDPVESWTPEECPMCSDIKIRKMVEQSDGCPNLTVIMPGATFAPLTDPKTGKEIQA